MVGEVVRCQELTRGCGGWSVVVVGKVVRCQKLTREVPWSVVVFCEVACCIELARGCGERLEGGSVWWCRGVRGDFGSSTFRRGVHVR